MVKAKTQGNDQESEAQGNEPPKPLPQHRSICYQAIRSARNFGCGSGSRLPVARFDPS